LLCELTLDGLGTMALPFERYGLTLGEATERAAGRAPDRVICRTGAQQLTLAVLNALSNRIANGLIAHGFQAGDRAALLMPSRPEFLVALVAVARAGGTVEFLMPQYGGVELAEMLRSAPPRWLFYDQANCQEAAAVKDPYCPETVVLEEHVDAPLHWSDLLAQDSSDPPGVVVRPQDDAMILFTSGTTGEPKAVRRTHNSVVSHGVLYNHYLGMDNTSISGAMQFSYETPAQLLVDGGCLILADVLRPREWLGTIERERITHIGGVTSLLQLWLSYPGWAEFDLGSVRSIAVGAMSTPQEVHQLTRERLGVSLLQMYGSIEAGLLAVNDPADGAPPESLGRPVEGKELRIVDEQGEQVPAGVTGELLARPTSEIELGFTSGYCGQGAPPWVDGWLRTGDLVYRDEKGYLFLVGRTFETINVAGHKVYAPEIERVLLAHPAVIDAAVIGQPDARRGEIVVAFVVLDPQREASTEELRAHCGAHLAPHKIPRRTIVQECLPRTAMGKVDKLTLKAQVGRV
jgi:acyl-coenzyme A synthetase/AMP-(fatty) acid ligase